MDLEVSGREIGWVGMWRKKNDERKGKEMLDLKKNQRDRRNSHELEKVASRKDSSFLHQDHVVWILCDE